MTHDHRTTPGAYELWKQAGGGTEHYDRERYLALMLEHGHLIPLAPGEKREPLPCGWPDHRAVNVEPAAVEAAETGQDGAGGAP